MRAIKENPCEFEHPRCGAGHLSICDMCYLRNIEGKEKVQELLGEINSYIEKLQDRNGKIHALKEIREILRREE